MNRLTHWVMLTSYQYPILKPLWDAARPVALDRDSSDIGKLRAVVKHLKDGKAVGLFPEGALQRGERVLFPFEPGVGMIAKRGEATVVPVWIHGTPLWHHMFWHFVIPSRTTVYFGEPMAVDKRMDTDAVVQELRSRMLELEARAQRESR